jgi:small subunit ribosomal protein S8
MDPIANLLTIIRNAYLARKVEVSVPHSRIKEDLSHLLAEAGFVGSVEVEGETPRKSIKITLVYNDGLPALTKIHRISKPSVRVYAKAGKIPLALSGRGLTILSTSSGLMTDRVARASGLGGEVICQVW